MAIQELNEETKAKIIKEVLFEHKRRYGTKPSSVAGQLEPKRKTYLVKDLESDLEFILNHLTID